MRTLTYDTNFNNKLSCDSFIHITFAPVVDIAEHILSQPVLITVEDNPDLKVEVITLDLCRLKLSQLRSMHTIPSHGVLCYEFIEWWLLKYPKCHQGTEMAVYYHRRIN